VQLVVLVPAMRRHPAEGSSGSRRNVALSISSGMTSAG
jgi:hypothetical protein